MRGIAIFVTGVARPIHHIWSSEQVTHEPDIDKVARVAALRERGN